MGFLWPYKTEIQIFISGKTLQPYIYYTNIYEIAVYFRNNWLSSIQSANNWLMVKQFKCYMNITLHILYGITCLVFVCTIRATTESTSVDTSECPLMVMNEAIKLVDRWAEMCMISVPNVIIAQWTVNRTTYLWNIWIIQSTDFRPPS